MSLANLVVRKKTTIYDGQEITVKGLSTNDIAALVLDQMPSLEQLFDIAESQGVKSAADFGKVDIKQIGQRILVEMPSFVAHAIANAAGERDHWEIVEQLPAPVQVGLIRDIAELTFVDEAGFREFVKNVVAAVRSARGVMPPQFPAQATDNALPNGSSDSAQPSHS